MFQINTLLGIIFPGLIMYVRKEREKNDKQKKVKSSLGLLNKDFCLFVHFSSFISTVIWIIWKSINMFFFIFSELYIYRVSLKKVLSWCYSCFCSRSQILLFQMCFGIRILSPFHIATQTMPIQNINCPKNACTSVTCRAGQLFTFLSMSSLS